MRTFVKFGGLTTLEATREVPAGGAAGFVVNVPESPRNLSLEAIPPLVDVLVKDAEAWAVTVDPPAELIHRLFDEVGVDRVQVYGQIPSDLEFLEIHHLVPSLPVPPAGTPGPEPTIPPAEDYSRLHLDAAGHPLLEGSVQRADWDVCVRIVDTQPGRKIILAGGLTPESVGEALSTVHPWGLDVSAGVESSPGTMDVARMRAFLAAVESAEKPAV